MKKLLFLISICSLHAFVVFCQDKKIPPVGVKPSVSDTARSKMKSSSPGKASMHHKKKHKEKINRKAVAITHNAPDQQKIDSIKNAKTKLKK